MRDSVVSRLKNIAHPDPFQEIGTQSSGPELPPTPRETAALEAHKAYLHNQAMELLNGARFLHARILLAIQANELDPQLRKVLFDGFLNMAALVEVKE